MCKTRLTVGLEYVNYSLFLYYIIFNMNIYKTTFAPPYKPEFEVEIKNQDHIVINSSLKLRDYVKFQSIRFQQTYHEF